MLVVLTAMEVERAAVRARMTGVRRHVHQAGTVFDVGELAGRPAALGMVGAGNARAAAIAERAVAEFSPSAVVFTGVAGGLRDWLRLGDVVVARKVYAYHGGYSDDAGFRNRPEAWEPSHRLLELARALAREGNWSGAESVPEVHFEPIAAGEVVVDGRTSAVARYLWDNYNDAVAVEMESAGFALTGQLNDNVPALTVRGISDRADGAKDVADEADWQAIAAGNAADFVRALAAGIGGATGARQDERTELPAATYTNVARDNAHVGQQVGAVYGDFHVTQRSPRRHA
ncbi:purine phosphorylase family 1 [Amycolatopsis mediterranei S699]|uniref:Purine phosphorylase family 1 n=3 Tax=Amycolatopsis mediterranei TaxID=33910 RepID=A0A0H3DI61_AMYMU|nr:5'-methylthioadenosine/S-adenosylhomocysteine nucleosidase [Amycolatopsis mediterranei]ADJ49882.1 purine phosphorylase family 1 [Amycolatopsis mediterranei U32]AEK46872.1 purine phosphorylase family 1 [Amycolatopsis mediterranei S699]AFO81590.1 purine phosphorylase family 1 [Amycolatopsis mediterranei S699]AGT88719.1 purine phosphorylase family 1 [Amycolatopsis mediterranei RB]KDO07869.1 purine phosphorylase [Amycolatopsis mediterranei]